MVIQSEGVSRSLVIPCAGVPVPPFRGVAHPSGPNQETYVKWFIYDAIMTNVSGCSLYNPYNLRLISQGASDNACHSFIINERFKFTKKSWTQM